MIPPFPLDASTRKPIANRSPTTAAQQSPRDSEVDIPSDSDETPSPKKITPVMTSQVPIIHVSEVQRGSSAKSVVGEIENVTNDTPPPTPKAAFPRQTAMGTGYNEEPSPSPVTSPSPGPSKTVVAPRPAVPSSKVTAAPQPPAKPEVAMTTSTTKVTVIPQLSMTPPTPKTAQFPRDIEPVTTKAAPQVSFKEEQSESVTAEILRMSVASTDIPSGRTSMVVEGPSRANSTGGESRVGSAVFEMESTPPLVISKKEFEEKGVSKTNNVQTGERKLEYSLPPTLPALEQDSLFSFEDLR
jgi:hypothetical protein